jgi:hypothetical protein
MCSGAVWEGKRYEGYKKTGEVRSAGVAAEQQHGCI